MEKQLIFKKHVIGKVVNEVGNSQMNTFAAVGDINGDGRLDFAVCGRNGVMAWLENKGDDRPWEVHFVANVVNQECGGSLIDLTGNGLLDIINGSDASGETISWWENPGHGVKGGSWTQHLIANTGLHQFHDTLIADVTNDGTRSLVFTNQIGGTNIYRIPIPKDPYTSPWPGLEVVAAGKFEPNPYHRWNPAKIQPEEGLALGDVDNDGKNELVCGTHWYKYNGKNWESHRFTAGYLTTKVAIGDIDGDGKNEIVLSEGDPYIYGRHEGGRLAWFKPGQEGVNAIWVEHIVDEHLLDAHSLVLADLCGHSRQDMFVAEIGAADEVTDMYVVRPPRLMIYENDGRGSFKRHIIDEGTGTHEAVLVDLRKTGRLDILGKPLHGPEKWNIHAWYNESKDRSK